ncbi:MAG: S-methyl-5-thioribose-1-phosphate isomerase [Alphaproteobacteria bacterium]|nr:S-methyl-5-thioribose-1-phosphate isomerase [Alphaproteobacteria bacterium]MCB9694458.1 S-methyl-5-thioribose-1-phosphate isomerase [Alphaproteobacteria bacterium]
MIVDGVHQRTVVRDGAVVDLIDQPLLPHAFRRVRLHTVEETASAISDMIVRGAGAIGATAAAGMAQAALLGERDVLAALDAGAARLRRTRPTAQNLFYAIDAVLDAARRADVADRLEAALGAADAVIDGDAAACERIGHVGAELLADGMRVATHCNAGWLAFVDWGSALAPVYRAVRQGKRVSVWVDETRPRGQGARLTAWELEQEGVAHHVIADNALASRMRAGDVDVVITGADRIAANGDVANKIGTYAVALCARAHGIPFYVAAPASTFDPGTPDGEGIPIEERSAEEVAYTWGLDDDGVFRRVRTTRSPCRNPAFDVTPAGLVAGWITERGLFRSPGEAGWPGLTDRR